MTARKNNIFGVIVQGQRTIGDIVDQDIIASAYDANYISATIHEIPNLADVKIKKTRPRIQKGQAYGKNYTMKVQDIAIEYEGARIVVTLFSQRKM